MALMEPCCFIMDNLHFKILTILDRAVHFTCIVLANLVPIVIGFQENLYDEAVMILWVFYPFLALFLEKNLN